MHPERLFYFWFVLLLAAGCKTQRDPPLPKSKATVSIRQNQVFLDDSLVGEVAPGAFTKLEPLFAKLKANREEWKQRHPGESFPGRVELTVPGSLPCVAGLSVVASSAFAGYPIQSIKIDAAQRQDLAYSTPGPPRPDEGEQPPKDDLFLHLRNDGRVDMTWTRCAAKTVESVAPSAVADALAKHCATNPSACFDVVRIRCEPGAVFGAVGEALAAIQRSGFSRTPLVFAAREPNCKNAFGVTESFDEYRTERDPGPPRVATDSERATFKLVEEPFQTPGSLDRESVAKGLRSGWNAAEDCYVEAQQRNPNLEGRVRMRLQVARGGDVVRASNGGSDLPDWGLVSCILKAYDGRDLGPPTRETTTLLYGLKFTRR